MMIHDHHHHLDHLDVVVGGGDDDVVDSDVDDVNGWISGPLRGSDANKKKDSGRKSDSSKFLFFMTSHDDNDESLWVDDDVDTGNQ